MNYNSLFAVLRAGSALRRKCPVLSGSAESGKGTLSRHSAEPTSGLAASMLLITGGAGFIGSNVVASLNEAGRADIAVGDSLGSDGKWRNLGSRQVADIVPPEKLIHWLDGRKLDAVVHLGA